jgi:hypothetical protein
MLLCPAAYTVRGPPAWPMFQSCAQLRHALPPPLRVRRLPSCGDCPEQSSAPRDENHSRLCARSHAMPVLCALDLELLVSGSASPSVPAERPNRGAMMHTNCRNILSLGILSAVLLTGAGIIKAERGFAQTGGSSSHRSLDAMKMPPTMAPPMAPPTRRQTQEMPRPQSPPMTTQMPPPMAQPMPAPQMPAPQMPAPPPPSMGQAAPPPMAPRVSMPPPPPPPGQSTPGGQPSNPATATPR